MALNPEQLGEALDYILYQQFLSSNFRIYDRTKQSTLLMAGTKAVFSEIRDIIKEGFDLVLSEKFYEFIDFLSEKFNVPSEKLEKKLEEMVNQDFEVDTRLKFIQIVGAVREHFQDQAYKSVISQVKNMVVKKFHSNPEPTNDEINTILSTHFGPDFSLMVNLFVMRAWSELTGIPVKFRGLRMKLLNKLTSAVIKKLKETHVGGKKGKTKASHKPDSPPGLPGPPSLP